MESMTLLKYDIFVEKCMSIGGDQKDPIDDQIPAGRLIHNELS